MKKTSKSVCGVITFALIASSTCALSENINNGFPSGEHYNLNIHGKKLDYNCTPLEQDEFGNPVYGNSVFIPETGQGIQILIKSGLAKGKAAQLYSEFRVTDACGNPFDGDAAVVELPPNEKGYHVYARALAKPVGTDWTISYGGALFSAQDEYGNDLVDLGLVTPSGTAKPGETLVRNKGKSTGVDITRLFQWSGEVCTIVFPGSTNVANGTRQLCWLDNVANPDGIITSDDTFSQPVADANGLLTCGAGTLTLVPVYCTDYTDEWIFNIAELVESDWLIDNNGTKLVQLRFYPVQ